MKDMLSYLRKANEQSLALIFGEDTTEEMKVCKVVLLDLLDRISVLTVEQTQAVQQTAELCKKAVDDLTHEEAEKVKQLLAENEARQVELERLRSDYEQTIMVLYKEGRDDKQLALNRIYYEADDKIALCMIRKIFMIH